jgi:hypothetical protein
MNWKIPLAPFIVALLFHTVFFVLVLGTPMPPGFILSGTQFFLESHDAFRDLTAGIAPSQNEVIENIDSYNQYLMFVIILLPLAILLSILTFSLAQNASWNYLTRQLFSLHRLGRTILFHIAWLLIAVPLGFLLYYLTFFIGTLLLNLHVVIATAFVFIIFAALILFAIHITTMIGFLSVLKETKREVLADIFGFTKKEWLRLLAIYLISIGGLFSIVIIVQFLTTNFLALNYILVCSFLLIGTWLQAMVVGNFQTAQKQQIVKKKMKNLK